MKKAHLSWALILAAGSLIACNSGTDGSSTKSDTVASVDDNAGGAMSGNTSTTVDTGTVRGGNLTGADRDFVMEAASAGLMEVELGRMAQQTASNQRVKSFGEMMVRDHSRANDELKSLASAKNLMLPDSMMSKHKEHVNAMQKMKGKEFDRHYMQMMVKDHQEDVRKFEANANGAADTDLKNWAAKTLPVLRMHLDSAQAINKAKM